MSKTPVRELFDAFQTFTVLEDGSTFSVADNSQILVYPDDKDMSEDDLQDLEDGRLPEDGAVATICLRKLLNEALEAKLDCVKDLLELIGR
jgi:hypothetical protein